MGARSKVRDMSDEVPLAGRYDYIIVGAGSAGCVVANRLSADPGRRILLIESGPEAKSPFVTMPKAMSKLAADPSRAWRFPVDSHSSGEVWLRGRMLGGSSSLNGMIYSRGQAEDYDEWAARGNPSWGAVEMLRCFREMEDHELGADEVRGAGGPLFIGIRYAPHPTTELLIRAAVQAGIPRRDDLNHGDESGIGYLARTVKRGRRVSADTAFLAPVRHRRNLDVLTNTEVERVIIEDRRARGVLCSTAGRRRRYECRVEVILCAGALMSPKILQLSGIGPGHRLQHAGVPIIHPSPNVGANLREHLGVTLAWRLRDLPSHNAELRGLRLFGNVLRYYLRRDGVLSYGPFEAGGYFKIRPEAPRADAVLALSPFTFRRDQAMALDAPFGPEEEPGFSISGNVARPESRGEVWITCPRPGAQLRIWPNWLASRYDQETNIALVRAFRRIACQAAIRPFVLSETVPGCDTRSDEAILRAVKRLFTPGAHATGTCAMGSDARAVVDDHLLVRGVQGLRVVDLSVAPTPVSGATNGAAMAIGWRASELIGADARVGHKAGAAG